MGATERRTLLPELLRDRLGRDEVPALAVDQTARIELPVRRKGRRVMQGLNMAAAAAWFSFRH